MVAVEGIQFYQICICDRLKPVGICEQFDSAQAPSDERLKPLLIPSSQESTNGDEVICGNLCLFRGTNHDWLIPLVTKYIQITPKGVATCG